MARNLEHEFDTVKGDLSRLRNDIAALTEGFHGVATDRVRENINEAREKLSRWKQDATSQSRETLEDIAEEIEDRPLTSVLVAFGVGIILGRLLDR